MAPSLRTRIVLRAPRCPVCSPARSRGRLAAGGQRERGRVMQTAAIAAVFDQLYDPKLGIVSAVGEIGREPGAPDYIHVAARTCDPAALGGVGGRFSRRRRGADRATRPMPPRSRAAVTRYAAALYDRGGLPLSTFAAAGFPCIEPRAFALFSDGQYRRPGFPYVPFTDETPVRWASAVDLATGATVHVPASLVWHPFLHLRSAGDLPVRAAGRGRARLRRRRRGRLARRPLRRGGARRRGAVLARDDAAAAASPRHAAAAAPRPRPPLRGGRRPGRAPRGRPPTTASRASSRCSPPTAPKRPPSSSPRRPASTPRTPSPMRSPASPRTAVSPASRSGRCRRRRRSNDWEDVIDAADHLAFAASRENAERIAFILTSDDRRHLAERDSASTGSVAGDLDAAVGRVALTGVRVLAAESHQRRPRRARPRRLPRHRARLPAAQRRPCAPPARRRPPLRGAAETRLSRHRRAAAPAIPRRIPFRQE